MLNGRVVCRDFCADVFGQFFNLVEELPPVNCSRETQGWFVAKLYGKDVQTDQLFEFCNIHIELANGQQQ